MKSQNKVLLIIALPFIGALYFAAVGIANKSAAPHEAALAELGQTVSELRQALEKEKDASGLFLESKGAKFASELLAQRAKTDKQIKKIQAFMLDEFALKSNSNDYGTEFKQKLSLALDKLGKIEACRAAVSSLSLTRSEALGYYSDVSSALSGLR